MKPNRLLLSLLIAGLPVISQAENALSCVQGNLGQALVNQNFAPQKEQFTTLVDITPSSNKLQNSVGLSQGEKTTENQFATLVRFNAGGLIEARNGEQFSATRRMRYHGKLTYRVRMDVDLAARTYSVWVQPQGGEKARPFIRIAKDFAFNPNLADVAQLDTLGVLQAAGAGVPDYTTGDKVQACKLTVQGNAAGQGKHTAHKMKRPPPPPPVPLPLNPDCTLIVPKNPLTAAGLATPYKLVSADPEQACSQVNPTQQAFVQAAIIDPYTGQISIYSPLVIDKGTQPAVPPVLPMLPDGAIVAIWFGYNGGNLTLQSSGRRGDSLEAGKCVNGLDGSVFGQFAYCNAPAFFDAAFAAIESRKLVVPPLGTGSDGQACPTSRSFWVVDQDPSDNVPTEYLLIDGINGGFAQNTTANLASFPTAVIIANPSDERLVALALDPPLDCTPFKAPNLADPDGPNVAGLALNELQAAANPEPSVALVPPQDPMVLVDGERSLQKLNLYRAGVGEPPADDVSDASAAKYCRNYREEAPARFILNKLLFMGQGSPAPDDADSLFTFLANRYVNAYAILDCETLLGQPVNLLLTTTNGVVTDATLTTP